MPEFAEYRSVRGGSFSSMMPMCRLAARFALAEGDRMQSVGFRLVQSI